jgi:hypothetical protein
MRREYLPIEVIFEIRVQGADSDRMTTAGIPLRPAAEFSSLELRDEPDWRQTRISLQFYCVKLQEECPCGDRASDQHQFSRATAPGKWPKGGYHALR